MSHLRAVARRTFPTSFQIFKTLSSPLSWEKTGKLQQTIASVVERSGMGLHSGVPATVRLLPAVAGKGRYFVRGGDLVEIPASINHAVQSQLCTTLQRGSARISTVEHLLSALEGAGIGNVRIEIEGGDEVPILDGSSREWVEAIEEAGLCLAKDDDGNEISRYAPVIHQPLCVRRNDSFVAAFPDTKTQMTYAIDFPQVPAIGFQWLSCCPTEEHVYSQEIAPSRTFCILEEVERLRNVGLIKGGSVDNALICSSSAGWMNPPLRFPDEPCRHKLLDLIGDLSLLSENGNQGLPVAHLVAYKAGHALHVRFASLLKDLLTRDGGGQGNRRSPSSFFEDSTI